MVRQYDHRGLVSQLLELNINDFLMLSLILKNVPEMNSSIYPAIKSSGGNLLQHTHHHATIGMYQYTSLLRSSLSGPDF